MTVTGVLFYRNEYAHICECCFTQTEIGVKVDKMKKIL